jgi:hypothetical protein
MSSRAALLMQMNSDNYPLDSPTVSSEQISLTYTDANDNSSYGDRGGLANPYSATADSMSFAALEPTLVDGTSSTGISGVADPLAIFSPEESAAENMYYLNSIFYFALMYAAVYFAAYGGR